MKPGQKSSRRTVLFIEGDQGLRTLNIALSSTSVVLVVVPSGFDNAEIDNQCRRAGIPVISRRKGEPIDLSSFNVDVLISSQYQHKIDDSEFSCARIHAVNIHASELPKYKGKHSDVWALMNDEKQLGVTVHKLSPEFDGGDVLHIEYVDIDDSMSNKAIYSKMMAAVDHVVRLVCEERLDSTAHYADMPSIYWRVRTLSDSLLNWRLSSRNIFLFVRALSRDPIYAYTYYAGRKIVVKAVTVVDDESDALPGTVMETSDGIFVVCGDSRLVRLDDYACEGTIESGMVFH